MEIKKIRLQGTTKVITIPKYSDLQVGDYVKVTKISVKKNMEVSEEKDA